MPRLSPILWSGEAYCRVGHHEGGNRRFGMHNNGGVDQKARQENEQRWLWEVFLFIASNSWRPCAAWDLLCHHPKHAPVIWTLPGGLPTSGDFHVTYLGLNPVLAISERDCCRSDVRPGCRSFRSILVLKSAQAFLDCDNVYRCKPQWSLQFVSYYVARDLNSPQ